MITKPVIITLWIGFGLFAAAHLYLVIMLLFQRVKKLRSRDEIFDFLEDGVYSRTNDLRVLAGEANIGIYHKLCADIDKALSNRQNAKATFIIGPELSYWNKNSRYLKDGFISDGCSDPTVLQMHPLFPLIGKYPNRLSVFLKTDANNEPHFAVGDDFVYVESNHKPLEESTAMFIDHPSILLKLKYRRKYRKFMSDNKLQEIKSAQDIKRFVKFNHVVDDILV